jgi:hypothetical protein
MSNVRNLIVILQLSHNINAENSTNLWISHCL